MKTSKRLLSIVLMLAMLVSMFTVMAFAEDTITITVNVTGDGKGNVKLLTEGGALKHTATTSTSWTIEKDKLENAAIFATAEDGSTAKLYFDGVVVGSNALDLSDIDTDFEVTAEFTKVSGGDAPVEAAYDLTVTINDGGVKGAKVLAYGSVLSSGTTLSVYKGDTWEFTTEADEDYTVVWKLDGKKASSKNSYTLDKTLKSNKEHTLEVIFTAVPKPAESYKLTANVQKIDNKYPGTVKIDRGTADTSVSAKIESGETVTLRAYEKDGYEFVKWVSEDYTIGTSEAKNPKLTITMPEKNATITATFRKIETTGKYKLTLDVSRHGDVYENSTRGDDAKSYYWLDDDDELTFKAVADKGYEVRWRIDKGRWNYTSKITVNARDMDWDNATLYIDFVRSGSSSTPSTKTHTLTLDITGGKHGTVSYKNSTISDGKTYSLEKNDTMTFKAEPDKGYLTVWQFGSEVYLGNSYTVTMGSKDATLYVTFIDKDEYRWGDLPFHDVTNRNWYYDDVLYAYLNGLMDGISITEFGADQNTTRGQVVTILWRLTGEPRAARNNQFTDVASSAYYNTAISWAAENGIVKGYDAKTFRPNANVTREQLAAILYRYAEYMNLSTRGASNLTKFDDYYSIGTWARDSLAWANYHGLINGVDSYHIDPKGNTTRAQLAAILHRFAVEFA